MGVWEPSRYLRFESERTQPCIDLARRIDLDAPRRVVDLGCGPGNSTTVLRARWPRAQIFGVDSSPEMLAKARATPTDADWVEADILRWRPKGRPDLIFSNAALHWLPGHERLLPRLLGYVPSGGVLAFQVPANEDGPTSWKVPMGRVVARPRWRTRFRGPPSAHQVEDLPTYYGWLAPRCRRIDLWDTLYVHALPSPEAILEWVRGAGLRRWLDLLPDEGERERFMAEVRREFARAYPRQLDGNRLFPFLRRFVIAYRK